MTRSRTLPLVALLLATTLLVVTSKPRLGRSEELSSGDFDSNSDCIVLGDVLTFRSPGNVVDGLVGGHGRKAEAVVVHERAYRVVFMPDTGQARVVRVETCNAHVGGRTFVVDGSSVDAVLLYPRGRVVVDRIPDRGEPARQMRVEVPWEGRYDVKLPPSEIERYESAPALVDARVLVRRGLEPEGSPITYELYDYVRARASRLRIARAYLPKRIGDSIVISFEQT